MDKKYSKSEKPKLKIRQKPSTKEQTSTHHLDRKIISESLDQVLGLVKQSIETETPEVLKNKLRSVAKILNPEQLAQFKATLKNNLRVLAEDSRSDPSEKIAVLVSFCSRKHIDRQDSVVDQEYKAKEQRELKAKLQTINEDTLYHGEALKYSNIKKFCRLIYGINTKETPRSIADKRKFYLSNVITDQLEQAENETNLEQLKELEAIRVKEGLDNSQQKIYGTLENRINKFNEQKGKNSENYVKNIPVVAANLDQFQDILLSLVVPANSIGDTEAKVDVLNIHFNPNDFNSISPLENKNMREKLLRVQTILDQALSIFNMKNATDYLDSTNYLCELNAELKTNTVFEVVNDELKSQTKKLEKLHRQLISEINTFKEDIFSTDYKRFLEKPELITDKIKQIDKFTSSTDIGLKDKIRLKQQQRLHSIYNLLSQEEALQNEVAKILYEFLDEEHLSLTYSGVQVKSSKKGLEEHVAKNKSGVIVREQTLTDASLVRKLQGEIPELVDEKLKLLEKCYANLLYSNPSPQQPESLIKKHSPDSTQNAKGPKSKLVQRTQQPKIKPKPPIINSSSPKIHQLDTQPQDEEPADIIGLESVENKIEEGDNTYQNPDMHVLKIKEGFNKKEKTLVVADEKQITSETTKQKPSPVSEKISEDPELERIEKVDRLKSNVANGKFPFEVFLDTISGDTAVAMQEDGREFHINLDGQRLYDQTYYRVDPFKEDLAIVENDEGISIMNENGRILNEEPLPYHRVFAFMEGVAIAQRNDNARVYINRYGEQVFPESYASAQPFVNGKALVKTIEGKKTVIDKKGEKLFDTISNFKDNIAIATKDDLSYHVGRDYKPLYPQRYKKTKPFVGSYAKVESEDTVYVINKQGEVVAKHPLASKETTRSNTSLKETKQDTSLHSSLNSEDTKQNKPEKQSYQNNISQIMKDSLVNTQKNQSRKEEIEMKIHQTIMTNTTKNKESTQNVENTIKHSKTRQKKSGEAIENKPKENQKSPFGANIENAARKISIDPFRLLMFQLMFGKGSSIFPEDITDDHNLDIIKGNILRYEFYIKDYLEKHCNKNQFNILNNSKYFYPGNDLSNEKLEEKILRARGYAKDKLKEIEAGKTSTQPVKEKPSFDKSDEVFIQLGVGQFYDINFNSISTESADTIMREYDRLYRQFIDEYFKNWRTPQEFAELKNNQSYYTYDEGTRLKKNLDLARIYAYMRMEDHLPKNTITKNYPLKKNGGEKKESFFKKLFK